MFICISVTKIDLTSQSGEISSPMYPRTYRDSEDYSWKITVDQGKRVQILINDLISSSGIHELKVNEYIILYVQKLMIFFFFINS